MLSRRNRVLPCERKDTAGTVPGVPANACRMGRSRRPCGKEAPLSSLPQVGGFSEALLMRLGHRCDTCVGFVVALSFELAFVPERKRAVESSDLK